MNLDPEAAPRVGLADLWREFKRLRQEVGFLRSAQGVLAAATIGRGGLVIEDGGSITVLGGSVGVTGGGSVVVSGGGNVDLKGGSLKAYHADGVTPGVYYGPVTAGGSGNAAIGIIVQDAAGMDVFDAYTDLVNGERVVFLGHPANPLRLLQAGADEILMYGDSGNSYVWLPTTGEAYLVSTSGTRLDLDATKARLASNGHSLEVRATGVEVTANGTASGANVHMTATGVLQLVGSARALKVDIGDLAPGTTDALLALTPRRFRDKAQAEDDPDGAPFILGFIADEVDAAGLTDLVTYDENGEPVAVAYDRITAPLVALVQQQQAQIDDLAAQVQALTARLDALSV